jgi:hypothetical protein
VCFVDAIPYTSIPSSLRRTSLPPGHASVSTGNGMPAVPPAGECQFGVPLEAARFRLPREGTDEDFSRVVHELRRQWKRRRDRRGRGGESDTRQSRVGGIYSSAVDAASLPRGTTYLNVVFRHAGRVVSVHAKRARGCMAARTQRVRSGGVPMRRIRKREDVGGGGEKGGM